MYIYINRKSYKRKEPKNSKGKFLASVRKRRDLSLTRLSRYGSRGLLFMISDSACSYAKDIAGIWQVHHMLFQTQNNSSKYPHVNPVCSTLTSGTDYYFHRQTLGNVTTTQRWKSSIKSRNANLNGTSIDSIDSNCSKHVEESLVFERFRGMFVRFVFFFFCFRCAFRARLSTVTQRWSKRANSGNIERLTMSVPKSMQRIVTVPRGRGMSQRMNARKGEISGMFEVRVYAMDFFRLSKINRPSSTPVTIEAKLSSSRIMSAACFDTSEPAIPIATPMSAFFNAGESFTPSPEIV